MIVVFFFLLLFSLNFDLATVLVFCVAVVLGGGGCGGDGFGGAGAFLSFIWLSEFVYMFVSLRLCPLFITDVIIVVVVVLFVFVVGS